MGILNNVNHWIGSRFGVKLMRTTGLYDWQKQPEKFGARIEIPHPDGAAEYLNCNNPRLVDLIKRYRDFDPLVTVPTVWTDDKIDAGTLRNFRGDTPYVWQRPGLNSNDVAYLLAYYALKGSGARAILDQLDEDGLFGAYTHPIDGRLISRDLLDSVREIDFLNRHAGLGTSSLSVLDIGAGYGRLAYRLHQATNDDVKIFATDAFPHSTFLSEYYLRFRNAGRARVVAIDEVSGLLETTSIDIAINVHSFSECTLDAIEWWTKRLAQNSVRYLMVVPNTEARSGQVLCRTNDGQNMEEVFARHGYRPVKREPRYLDPQVQAYALDPAQLNLFELA